MSATTFPKLGRWSRLLFLLLLLSLGLWLSTAVPASNAAMDTLIINSTNDGADVQVGDGVCDEGTGHCTLRAAMMEANAASSKINIHFNIPGPGPHIIQPQSALPFVENTMVIDGYTQPGAQPNSNPAPQGLNTQLMIGIDGSQTGGSIAFAFNPDQWPTIDGLVIRGLAIYNFGSAIGGGYAEGFDVVGARFVGNFIGTDVTGSLDYGNGVGVILSGHRLINIDIGGSLPEDRNLIAGNSGFGVYISSRYPENIHIQGNLIGTDVSGRQVLPNASGGVFSSNAWNILIGGVDSGATNVISGNTGNGIELYGNDGYTNIRGNLIGLAADGQTPLANTGSGIWVGDHLLTLVDDNRIAYNLGDGLTAYWYTTAVSLPNAIFSNGGLGIDLNGDGVTPNDPLDSDSGPNDLQNYPLLASVVHTDGSVVISGMLQSRPNQTYLLTFFTNGPCDPSGYGEGEAFATELEVTTDDNGDALFTAVFPQQSERPFVTATASYDGATSEFSQCRADPLYLVTLLRTEVQQLSDDGVLPVSAGMRLLAKLDNVEAALLAGHENTALLRLQDFISSVRNLMNRRQLPHELGQPLIDAAWAIIYQITLP